MQVQAPTGALFELSNPQAVGTLEVLQNLLYLIRLDASNPDLVRVYAEQAEAVLLQKPLILNEYPC